MHQDDVKFRTHSPYIRILGQLYVNYVKNYFVDCLSRVFNVKTVIIMHIKNASKKFRKIVRVKMRLAQMTQMIAVLVAKEIRSIATNSMTATNWTTIHIIAIAKVITHRQSN